MKRTIIFLFKTALLWLVFFTFAKLLFLSINVGQSLNLNFKTLTGVFVHGLKLDISMSAYCTLILMLTTLLGTLISSRHSKKILFTTGYLLILVNTLLIVFDARLYQYWGFKLDLTAFAFLTTPKEAMASLQTSDILVASVGIAILLVGSILAFNKLFKRYQPIQKRWQHVVVHIVVSSFLILPIRGGTGVSTVGLSSAYFSPKIFANHAAVNTTWNLMYTWLNKDQSINSYLSIDPELTKRVMDSLYTDRAQFESPANLDKPVNVVLIVLESYSAGLIEGLGGSKNVTPNLNRLMDDYWSFTNFYASGDRSDKGLASIFTGAPALPESSVLRFPDKLSTLSHMYTSFIDQGYETSFIYGGNLDFANLRSLFTVVDGCKIIDKDQLSQKSYSKKGKWGIHDEHTFEFLTEYLATQPEPFFTSLYTLSSHEPFDVPFVAKSFAGKDAACFRAAWYTDSCLGAFIKKLSATDLWKRTLVVITADHGIRNPGNIPVYHPEKFHIPLVFTGGVIPNHLVFTSFGSHTDLPYTLQRWLIEKNDEQMAFSKSLFNSSSSFANYFYQVGSGMIDSSGCVVYDFNINKLIFSELGKGIDGSTLLQRTQCYTKAATDSYLKNPKKKPRSE